MTRDAAVAPDTNIMRQSTPRRYLTALEGLRGRRPAILPMVDYELRLQLVNQATDHIRKLCTRDEAGSREEIDAAAKAVGRAARDWWRDENCRNDSVYVHLIDLGDEQYSDMSAELPGHAFTDSNGRVIYAQA